MKPQLPLPDDCASLASCLTALFDGEADSDAAARARAHLLSCQECARLWLDWNQHRGLLQAQIVPPPPPTLVWRVLIACRLAAFARPARRRSRLSLLAAFHQTPIEAKPQSDPSTRIAPLRGLEAPLPPDLSAHILRRTSRAPGAAPLLTAAPAPTRFAKTVRWNRFSWMAAPALALWLLLLGRSDFLATAPPVAAPKPVAAPSPAKSKIESSAPKLAAHADGAATSALVPGQSGVAFDALIAPRQPVPELAADAGAPVDRVPAAARIENARLAPRRAARRVRPQLSVVSMTAVRRDDAEFTRLISLAMARARNSRPQSARSAPSFAARQTSAPASQAKAPARSDSTAPASAPARSEVAPARSENSGAPLQSVVVLTSARARVVPRVSSRARQASFAGEPAAPRVARSSAGGARLARLSLDESDTALRSSRPAPGAPAFRSISFGGDADGSRADGTRVEDLRSAVDDFRAAISDEDTGGN